jgi:hypothetical protein
MEEHDDQEERRRYRSVPNSLSCDPINRTKSQPVHARDWHISPVCLGGRLGQKPVGLPTFVTPWQAARVGLSLRVPSARTMNAGNVGHRRGSVGRGRRLSRGTGCNIETIRYYERIGLLPKPTRSTGRYRLYQTADVRRLVFIRRAPELGFPLDAVRALLKLSESGQGVRDATPIYARRVLTPRS